MINVLLVVTGLLFAAFAIYIGATAYSSFFWLLLGIATYHLLVGILGIVSVNGKTTWLSRLYSIFFLVIVLLQLAVVIALIVYEDQTIQKFAEWNVNTADNRIVLYLQDHKTGIKIGAIVMFAVEVNNRHTTPYLALVTVLL